MSDGDTLFVQICKNPKYFARYFVYADWLDEQGKPKARKGYREWLGEMAKKGRL